MPAVLCIATGICLFRAVPDDRRHAAERIRAGRAARRLALAVAVFGLFILIGITAGLVFNTVTIALPKVIDERMAQASRWSRSAALRRRCSCAARSRSSPSGGWWRSIAPHLLFAVIVADAVRRRGLGGDGDRLRAAGRARVRDGLHLRARSPSTIWSSRATPPMPGAAASMRCATSSPYLISGAAITMIAFLHGRGGFDLVLTVTVAVIGAGFVTARSAWRCLRQRRRARVQICRSRRNSALQNSGAARSTTSTPVRSLHDFGDAAAVAMIHVALVAEQAHAAGRI